jgi:hypothetical protein
MRGHRVAIVLTHFRPNRSRNSRVRANLSLGAQDVALAAATVSRGTNLSAPPIADRRG